MAIIRRLFLLSALLLAGCDMAPRYVRPAMPVPPVLPGPQAAPAVTAGADLSWQEFFTDDRLRSLIAVALANNRDLRIAAGRVAQARAQYGVSRADLGPTIGVRAEAGGGRTPAGIGGENGSGTRDSYSVQAGISAWEVDLFGRIRNLSRAAQERYFASREAQGATRIALGAEIASAYLALAADQDRLRIARDTARTFQQTLELNTQRFLGGIGSELEVRQAETSYQQARSDVADLTTRIGQGRNRIELLVGASVAPELLPPGLRPQGSTVAQLPANLSSDVLLRRPDVAEAEHQLRAANADIGAARAAFFPMISLTAVAGTLSGGLSGLFEGGSSSWSVAPSATLPIFDFGRNRGNLRYTEATRDVAVAEYERAIQMAFREVADALARRATIGSQLEAQTALRRAAGIAYRLSEARFRTGVEPFLNTLDAQRTLYAAKLSLIGTRQAAELNLVELYRALGGGLREPS
jgi:multidrug efflux system outer membrane protein